VQTPELLLCWEHYKKGFPQKSILNSTLESSGKICGFVPVDEDGHFCYYTVASWLAQMLSTFQSSERLCETLRPDGREVK